LGCVRRMGIGEGLDPGGESASQGENAERHPTSIAQVALGIGLERIRCIQENAGDGGTLRDPEHTVSGASGSVVVHPAEACSLARLTVAVVSEGIAVS